MHGNVNKTRCKTCGIGFLVTPFLPDRLLINSCQDISLSSDASQFQSFFGNCRVDLQSSDLVHVRVCLSTWISRQTRRKLIAGSKTWKSWDCEQRMQGRRQEGSRPAWIMIEYHSVFVVAVTCTQVLRIVHAIARFIQHAFQLEFSGYQQFSLVRYMYCMSPFQTHARFFEASLIMRPKIFSEFR